MWSSETEKKRSETEKTFKNENVTLTFNYISVLKSTKTWNPMFTQMLLNLNTLLQIV